MFLKHAFVYAPGLVILVFSMLALHSSLAIVRLHEHIVTSFDEESRSLFMLEEKFSRFEAALLGYLETPQTRDPGHVKKSFTEFVDAYTGKVNQEKQRRRHSEFSGLYQEHLSEIDTFLMPLSFALQDLEYLEQKETQVHLMRVTEPVHEKIETLIRLLSVEYTNNHHQKELRQREDTLYWSVIAVGFAGFILLLLNANKLHQLRMAESERKENMKLLQLRLEALEGSFDGIGIIDPDGRLTYMNAALRNLHGISEQDAGNYLGHNWGKLYTKKGQDYIESHVMPQLREMGHWSGESPIVRTNGEIVFAELQLTKLTREDGYIGMARNITDRKKSDKTREELQGQLHQAQKMEAIGRLAGGFAHDFNNILASMNGYAEFLLDDLDHRTQQYNFAQNILNAGQQARELVDQILAFSRRQKTVSEMNHIDLAASLQESIAIVAASMPKTIELKTDINAPQSTIYGNVSQLSQLIVNLCVNAMDAMENQHGKLRIGLREIVVDNYEFSLFLFDDETTGEHTSVPRIQEVKPGHTRLFMDAPVRSAKYLALSVQDTGCGMRREVLEHVFEPFFTTKPVDKGTGLGLSMAHAILANHGAALMIDSIVGQGTTFRLYFPLSQAKAQEQADEHEAPVMLTGQRILLVEDQDEVRDMMVGMLERIGAEAYGCISGEDAVEVIRENEDMFDLVITDQNMPKMTGLELVDEISRKYPDLPFVLLSGYSEEKLQALMQQHPSIKAILKKPISKVALSKELGKIFGIKPRPQLKRAGASYG